MSEWKAIFKNKKRREQDEGYACCGCGAKVYEPGIHKTGPENGLCTCSACMGKVVSNGFRENYRATFGHD